MPMSEEMVRSVGLPYSDIVALSETMAVNKTSTVYKGLREALTNKLAVLKRSNDTAGTLGRKRRLVVPQALPSEDSYMLMKEFGEYKLDFKSLERVDAPTAKAIVDISIEKLFDLARYSRGRTICFGMSLKHLVIHNRTMHHLCSPTENAFCSFDAIRDDRALVAVLNSAQNTPKPMPMFDKYNKGDIGDIYCPDPVSCTESGRVGLAYLGGVDTNYLQVCAWMKQHGMLLSYISFPTGKAAELGYNGTIPGLGADVIHEGEKFHLVYQNAMSMARTFTHANHLTLIAKTYESLGDDLFVKEYVGHQLGISTYKITRQKKSFIPPDTEYKSWSEVGHEKRYVVKSYDLVDATSDPRDPKSYVPFEFETSASEFDDLLEYVSKLQGDMFTPAAVARRLRVMATTRVQAGYSIVYDGYVFDETHFRHIVLVVYAYDFHRRFRDGITAERMRISERGLRELSTSGVLMLMAMSFRKALFSGISDKIESVHSRLSALLDRTKATPVPDFVKTSPFVTVAEYGVPLRWSSVKSWSLLLERPWKTFSPYLPGFDQALVLGGLSGMQQLVDLRSLQLFRKMLDQAVVPLMFERSIGASWSVTSDAVSIGVGSPTQAMSSSFVSAERAWKSLESVNDEMVRRTGMPLQKKVKIPRGPLVDDPVVSAVAKAVVDDDMGLHDVVQEEYLRSQPLVAAAGFVDVHNGRDSNPAATISHALNVLFPGSGVMVTSDFAYDINNGGYDVVACGPMIKITTAALQPSRNVAVYKPKMPGTAQPDATQNQTSTLLTVTKRNLNSMSSVDLMSSDELWESTWADMKKAYYVPDVEEQLAGMNRIASTYESVAVWASRLDDKQRELLLDKSFNLENLDSVLQDSYLMLKGKRKPNLGPSYGEVVKPSQSIQYDKSKTRTAVFSNLFAEKVRRDQALLRDDVFIMQSKSPAELNKFLSNFKHTGGVGDDIRYIMIDAEMFDKSQVFSTLVMHWKKCEKFGMLPRYVDVLRDNTGPRTASSVAAGLKIAITPQRGSGDSDTLDGNCDVSQAAYAKFIAENRHNIVFVLLMGDDVTIAYRGNIDLTHVEADTMRAFNLSVKLTESAVGDFVGGMLLHMPDGSIIWRGDPVKRAVSLGSQSLNEFTDFNERWQSFADVCAGISGFMTQRIMAKALSVKYSRDLGRHISEIEMYSLTHAVSTVAENPDVYRSFFAENRTRRLQ